MEGTVTDAARAHAADLLEERKRYDGLSKQLLLETAHQRETFQTERQRLESEIGRVAERLAALEALRERLLTEHTELAEQRHAQQQATAEAAALTTVVDQQRQMLALMGQAAGKAGGKGASTAGRRAARPAVHTGQKSASGRKAR